MRRLTCLVLCLMLAAPAVLAEEPASFFEDAEAQKFGKITRTYDSPTLKYTVEKIVEQFLEDLGNYCEGKPLKHLVDRPRGY